MVKRFATIFAGLFLSVGVAVAQSSIKGTVTSSEDGSPVVGAAVMVDGTKTGTVTDIDGRFELNVPAGSKLVITYLGMKKKTVTAGANMKVALDADNKELNEVVVTAMGITRDKKALGYSAQNLKASDLNVAGTSSLSSALQGKLTGVSIRQSSCAPGASAQITIRGATATTRRYMLLTACLWYRRPTLKPSTR